jgi:succinoglycan biosynthesis protein ExoV
MQLYFHKDPLGNFGDDINPWLWEKVFPGHFSGVVYHDPRLRNPVSDQSPLFIGIGTLINQHVPVSNRKIAFGSGVGYGTLPRLDDSWEIAFVRGPYTAEKLGIPANKAIVDPAILVSEYASPEHIGGQRSFAYMPHCTSARNADWGKICQEIGLRFIDPQWPVEKVIQQLRLTSILITEALHGAIVAESLRIPWVPVKSSDAVLDFKWIDWCRSLGLTYQPTPLPALWRPAPGLGQLRHSFKRALAKSELKKLLKSHRPLLASEAAITNVRTRLLEEIEKFRTAHCRRPSIQNAD